MPGPPPKDPGLRQRRNRSTTAAKLSLAPSGDVSAPKLGPRIVEDEETGDRRELEWHPMAVSLWEDVWASPMAGEYLDADVHGLRVLVALTDAYWRRMEAGQVSGAAALAAELRLQRQAFGLSPIDRRRLQWEVDRGDEAETRRTKRAEARKAAPRTAGPRAAKADPRRHLAPVPEAAS